MQKFFSLLIITALVTSCGQTENTHKTAAEQETAGPVTQIKQPQTEEKEISFVTHAPCTFSISLPSAFTLQEMYADKSPDFCDYVVKTEAGTEVIELHSMLSSRFETTSIRELYQAALAKSELDISYKAQQGNWFVISGTKKDGKIVYWKRVSGEQFISDLNIEYSKSEEPQIAPYIGTISKSFESK